MTRHALAILAGILVLAGCGTGSINGPVDIAAGQTTGDVQTVNGDVSVGDGATIGSAMTVNGSVTLGSKVTAQSVKTVNGGVKAGPGTKLSNGVKTVNGSVTLEKEVDVAGDIANVNGPIKLAGAHVGGGIKTVNADIDIGSGSRVDGGIRVEKAEMSGNNKTPRIVIGPNATVTGGMVFEHEVKLYVSESAQISGEIEGATAEKFAGETPPN